MFFYLAERIFFCSQVVAVMFDILNETLLLNLFEHFQRLYGGKIFKTYIMENIVYDYDDGCPNQKSR